jgi:hypothetical protein
MHPIETGAERQDSCPLVSVVQERGDSRTGPDGNERVSAQTTLKKNDEA